MHSMQEISSQLRDNASDQSLHNINVLLFTPYNQDLSSNYHFINGLVSESLKSLLLEFDSEVVWTLNFFVMYFEKVLLMILNVPYP